MVNDDLAFFSSCDGSAYEHHFAAFFLPEKLVSQQRGTALFCYPHHDGVLQSTWCAAVEPAAVLNRKQLF
jgi:hypothetical protein